MEYFIKFKNSPEYRWLIKERPTAFVLLSLVASRAKTSDKHPEFRLEIGESYHGDYKNYGVSEQIYRTDKAFLEKANFITSRPTNKGTVIKLVSSSIFNVMALATNEPANKTATSHQRLTKNVKKEKRDIYTSFINGFNAITGGSYRYNKANESNLHHWLKTYTEQEILMAVKLAYQLEPWWKDKLTPERFLRTRNKNGACDNIGDMLNKYEGKYEIN